MNHCYPWRDVRHRTLRESQYTLVEMWREIHAEMLFVSTCNREILWPARVTAASPLHRGTVSCSVCCWGTWEFCSHVRSVLFWYSSVEDNLLLYLKSSRVPCGFVSLGSSSLFDLAFNPFKLHLKWGLEVKSQPFQFTKLSGIPDQCRTS